ncbi:MAG: pentapeptide repeat-containing protein [Saprospiraceae bacterium]
MVFIEEQQFSDLIFKDFPIKKGEYAYCIFTNCDFYEADLSNYNFNDCEFLNCNFSLIKTEQTALRNIRFVDCKLMGVHFDECNQFGLSMSFNNCIVSHCIFDGTTLKGTMFEIQDC